ncbi:MAG: hypothetical protein J7599_22130 [Niabella sp.]|nr:hypothetical protein [Niabella sp.]
MTGKPFLILAFVMCCSLSAAGQVTNTGTVIKKDSAFNRAPVLPKTGSFSVRPVALHTAYYNHLGFMCRQELKLEKATKTSLRFRLGSVEYTDQMEGKVRPVIR